MSYTTLQKIREIREALPKIIRDLEFLTDEDVAALATGLKGLQRFADALQSESDKRSQSLPFVGFGEMEDAPLMSQIEEMARLHEIQTRR